MRAVELDIPTPRPTCLRVENPEPETNFDPWMTWRTSWKCFVVALVVAGFGVLLTRVDWAFAMAPLIFGVLLGAFGLLGMSSGLLGANEEIRGHRFLVEQGAVAAARVVAVRYEDGQEKHLIYEFTDSRGRVHKHSCRAAGRGDTLRDLVVGYQFDVLYSPRNSRHFVPYAAALYQVAAQ